MGWLGTWKYKMGPFTIDQTKVDGDLTDFPALLYLSVASGISAEDLTAIFDELGSDANRKKIAVTTSDGTTQCYVEIERWDDASEVAWLWVKVPSVSGSVDTDLYLYFDSAQADNTTYVGDTTDAVTHNVWDTNFAGIWHMAQDPNGDPADAIKDSTSKQNDGTPSGSMLTADLVSAKCGMGIDFDGANDFISVPDNATLDITAQITLETIYKSDAKNDWENIAAKGPTYPNDPYLIAYHSGEDRIDGAINFVSDGRLSCSYSTAGPESAFVHIAVVYDGTNMFLYVDGVERDSKAVGSDAINASAIAFRIGDRAGDGYAKGIIDEVRLSGIGRSGVWLKATYHTCWDSLITFDSTVEEHTIQGELAEALTLSGTVEGMSLSPVLSEGVALSGAIDGMSLSAVIEEAVGLSDAESPAGSSFSTTLQEALGLSDIESTAGSIYCPGLDEDLGLSDVETPFNWTEWLSTYQQLAITRFYFTLTGAADGKTDVIIPISSVSCRLRSGDPTYLSVVIPYTSTYAGYINDRPNGDMRLDMGYEVDGEVVLQETVCTVDLETVAIDYGARNKSITLTGHRTVTYAPKVVDLANVNYYRQYDGNYTYRCATVDLYLKPGDTARYSSHSITVGRISWVISPTSQSMEVSEEN